MPITDNYDEYLISESGNWNVASDYSRFKIMRILSSCDDYSNIATFGTVTLQEELTTIQNYPNEILKLKGFDRLIENLVMLIDNTIFAIKYDKDKQQLQEIRKHLKESLVLKNSVYREVKKQHHKELLLDEEKYNKLLDYVKVLKYQINIYLNNSDLIFTSREEFDPKKYKDKIIEEATTKG